MRRKLTKLLIMFFMSLLLVACHGAISLEHSAPSHAGQCKTILHDLSFVSMHKHDWPQWQLQARQQELWYEYRKLGCPQ